MNNTQIESEEEEEEYEEEESVDDGTWHNTRNMEEIDELSKTIIQLRYEFDKSEEASQKKWTKTESRFEEFRSKTKAVVHKLLSAQKKLSKEVKTLIKENEELKNTINELKECLARVDKWAK